MKTLVAIRKSKIDGKGLFALAGINGRKKIGELEGEIISVLKGRRLAKQQKRIALVELDDKYALNATDNECPFKYINHSCSPNSYMRVFRHHVEFHTLKKINKGEEITCDYGETHHDGKLQCRCNSKNCKGKL